MKFIYLALVALIIQIYMIINIITQIHQIIINWEIPMDCDSEVYVLDNENKIHQETRQNPY